MRIAPWTTGRTAAGPGMVMMAEPLAQAVAAAQARMAADAGVTLAPNGRSLTDARVRQLAEQGGSLALVCGRYEAIDERFLEEMRGRGGVRR